MLPIALKQPRWDRATKRHPSSKPPWGREDRDLARHLSDPDPQDLLAGAGGANNRSHKDPIDATGGIKNDNGEDN